MFIIPCKYNSNSPYIVDLVKQIREFHLEKKIMVVDSDSTDKSYFSLLEPYNVLIEDIANKNWMIGAYWHGFKKYPNEEFYYFMHDSMKVKANLDYLKEKDLILIATFNRLASPSFNHWNSRIANETLVDHKYIVPEGIGCYGPIFFCKNKVMAKLLELKADVLMPENKAETGFMEGAVGLLLESLGYNLNECSLFGDILQLESPGGKSGEYPHNTTWQFPVEKFYASHKDTTRT